MKRKALIALTTLVTIFALTVNIQAQDAAQARKILDKTAAVIERNGGATANFSISGKNGSASGTISIKGNKFCASTPQVKVWYDGKTQWTYLKSSDEVNISTPTEAQQQSMNPYKFINIYKNGFKLSMKNVTDGWQIHLYATDQKRTIKEMYVTINKNYSPVTIKMRQSDGWTTIKVTGFKPANLADTTFRFNAKDYPTAEIIDLR